MDSRLLHVDRKPVSDGEVDLTVTLAASADRQVHGGREDRLLDDQGLRARVATTPGVEGLAVGNWIVPVVDDYDTQTDTLPWKSCQSPRTCPSTPYHLPAHTMAKS